MLKKTINQGFPEWQFSLSIVTSPPTVARCKIKTSASGFGPSSGDFGWEVRTSDSGKATLYSFKIDWVYSERRPLPDLMSPLWVRCYRGEQYVDSRLFAVSRGG